jgi:hypothetical protein
MEMRRGSLAALLLAAEVVLAGCGADPVIDTWPVGPATTDCGPNDCRVLLDVARVGFDKLHPGHAAIVGATLHEEGSIVNASGEQVLVTRSGTAWVARFELADGSLHAIGVGYPGVSREPQAFPDGP